MHPYVYKKQHKPLRFVLRIFIFIMILCPVTLANSHSCSSHAVKSVSIYSEFAKGFLRIEGNRVIASECDTDSCPKELYSITIDKHYFILYHNKSGKFICWNKSFTKLVARRNPTNLTYCKLEEIPSTFQGYGTVYVTTTAVGNRQVEIRIKRTGSFGTINYIQKCITRKNLGNYTIKFLRHLNSKNYNKNKMTTEAYTSLIKCASPNFLAKIEKVKENCASVLQYFCAQMKDRRDRGHNITSELTDLCKNEWNKRN